MQVYENLFRNDYNNRKRAAKEAGIELING